jgi:transcriptional regulator with XRE-family HTH domain
VSEVKDKYPNHLVRYRKRMRFSQEHAAHLLGEGSRATLSRLELGERLPTFLTALKLGAAYRVPVEFLYRDQYLKVQSEVRRREEIAAGGTQGELPLP